MMKNSDEMVKSLFERREQYITEQNKKRRIATRVTASLAACFIVIVLVAIAAVPTLLNNTDTTMPVGDEDILSEEKEYTTKDSRIIKISLFNASPKGPDADYFGEDELQHVDLILNGNRLYEQIPENEYSSYGIGKTLKKTDFGEFIGTITEIGPYSEDVLSTPCSQEPVIAGCDVFYYQPANCDAIIIVSGNDHCSLFRFMNFTEEGFACSDEYKVFNVLSADDIARIDYQIEKPDGTLIVTKRVDSITDVSDIQSFFNITVALTGYVRENALSGDPEWLNEAREQHMKLNINERIYVEASIVLKSGLHMSFSYQPNLGTGYVPGHLFLSEENNTVLRQIFQE